MTSTSAAVTATSPAPSGPKKRTSFRPDIQGLRTVAVLAVVLYHLWPHHVTGGFVGVDVFFVISGFLITGHMYRELMLPVGFSLLKFWARRIRRLLPAAFLVLLASLAAAYLWLPQTLWESTARQLTSSALYVQNWVLAGDAVDYSALNAAATVSQHYWSLSIEEQFYIAWPLLMVALLGVSKHVSAVLPVFSLSKKNSLVLGLVLVAATSLAFSIYETAVNPSAAYFVTTTRVWEFAVGALVALVFLNRQPGVRAALVLGWLGLASIVFSALLYSGATPFPGYTALLPVAGTAAILCCNPGTSKFSATWLLARSPMTFLGDLSYALYLWHWPLIVVAPFALSAELSPMVKLAILAVSILLSWLTKIAVEDPLRLGSVLSTNPRSFVFAALGMVIVAALSWGLSTVATSIRTLDPAFAASRCYGPGALNPNNACGPIPGARSAVPSQVNVMKENTNPAFPGCQASAPGTQLVSCSLGALAENAKTTVALVGDSHATAWFPALDRLGKENGWRVETFTKSSCPLTRALRTIQEDVEPSAQSDCAAWVTAVDKTLKDDPAVSAVFTAAYSSAYTFASPPTGQLQDPAVDGFTSMWEGWTAAGKEVLVFDDVPRTAGDNVPTCLAIHNNEPNRCSVPRAKALPANMAITKAAKSTAAPGITEIQLQEQFCDASRCYAQVGSMIVYRDYSHLSFEYSQALAPYIKSQLGSLKLLG